MIVFISCENFFGNDPKDEERYLLVAPSELNIDINNDIVTISWEDISENEDGYVISRSNQDSNFVEIENLSGDSVNTFQETIENRLYAIYRVASIKQVNGNRQRSAFAEGSYNLGPDSILISILEDQGDPENVDLIVEIKWDDNGTIEDGFIVKRKYNFEPFQELTTTDPNVVRLTERITRPGHYKYIVKAFNSTCESISIEDSLMATGWYRLPDLNYNGANTDAVKFDNGEIFLIDTGNGGYMIFNTNTHTWSAPVSVNMQGVDCKATLLQNDRVFIYTQYSRAAIYDKTLDEFKQIGIPTRTSIPNEYPFQEIFDSGLNLGKLANGDVLIAGVDASSRDNSLVILYKDETEEFVLASTMNEGKRFHTLNVLDDGTVLVTGGNSEITSSYATYTCELYDPTSDSWMNLPNMNNRYVYHHSLLLDDGRVLVCGDTYNKSCEIYNPLTNSWNTISTFLNREILTMFKNSDGDVIAITGDDYQNPRYTELYNLDLDEWIIIAEFEWNLTFGARRFGRAFTTTLLDDGRLILTGDGENGSATTSTTPVLIWRN